MPGMQRKGASRMVGELIAGPNTKTMYQEAKPGHRIFCESHRPAINTEVQVSLQAQCWSCLRPWKAKVE